MASRLIEILLPGNRSDEVQRILADLDLTVVTQENLADGRVRVRLVLEAERSGAVVDSFQQTFGGGADFVLLILPVEAALPRRDIPAPAQPTETGARINPRAVSREELYADITEMCNLSGVYIATVVLSALVAAVGMLRDNLAVIIGAMVIAPLLGPNVALALGTTLGDESLIRRSLRTNLAGMVIALLLSIVLGLVLVVDPTIRSIEDRTVVHLSDIVLVLASGSAGALAITTGVSSALVGVMVAVALLPPTVAVGLTIGDAHWSHAGSASLLLLANVICVNLAGVLTFLVQGIRPLSWWEASRARRATRRAVVIWIALLLVLVVVMLIE